MKYGPIVLTMALLAASAAQAGNVYTWTDDKGRTHYSDKPVAKAKKVEVVAPTPTPAPVDATAAARAQKCTELKEKLQTYQTAQRIREEDSLGKVREYSDDERKQLIARTQDQANQACAPQPPQADAAKTQKIQPSVRNAPAPEPSSPALAEPIAGNNSSQ